MREYLQKNQKLSLLWFVGRARTQRLELSWTAVLLAIVSVAFLILSSLASIFYLLYASQQRRSLKQDMMELRGQLFAMQVRYENVFDNVYMDKNPSATIAAISDMETLLQDKNPVSTPELSATLSEDKAVKLEASWLAETFMGQRWQVQGLRQEWDHKSGSLHLDYRLSHHASQERSTGYVWGILAYFAGENEDLSFLAAPDSKLLNPETGEVQDFQRGDRFYIRRFRDHRFTFQLPAKARPAWIMLQVADIDGKIDAQWQEVLDHKQFDGRQRTAGSQKELNKDFRMMSRNPTFFKWWI